MADADYIIVGAGSVGTVLTARLTEDSAATALVVEAGGSDWKPLIQMPAVLSYPMNMRRYDWGYRTEPEPGLDGRRLAPPRGGGGGRLLLHQRHGLRARLCAGLRLLGGDGRGQLWLRPLELPTCAPTTHGSNL